MSPEPPNGTVPYRIARLEADVEELKRGQPAVMAERVSRLSVDVSALRQDVNSDMSEIRDEMKSIKRTQVAAFSGLGLVIAGAVISIILQGGAP